MENNTNQNIQVKDVSQMSNSEFNIVMFQSLEQMRRENDKKINDINTRINLLDARQTAFDQRQNTFDLHLYNQDNKIAFLTEQIESIKKEVSKFGEQKGKSMDEKDISPEPLPGELEFLEGILKEHNMTEFQADFERTKANCLSSLAMAGIDIALSAYKLKKDINKLEALRNEDADDLSRSFIESFVSSSKTNIAIELGAKMLIIGGQYFYSLYNLNKKEKEIKIFWQDELSRIQRDLINLLQKKTYEEFLYIVEKYKNNYYLNYGRSDSELEIYRNNKSAPYYIRKFKNIPDYQQNIDEYTLASRKIFDRFKIDESMIFNQDDFLDLSFDDKENERRKNEFSAKFRLYRAIKEIGEFEDHKGCGDYLQDIHIVANIKLYITAFLVGMVCLPGGLTIAAGGAAYSAGAGATRAVKENRWKENASLLRKILVNCIEGRSEDMLEKVIKRKHCFAIIKHYVELSNSKFAKEFLNKILEKENLNIRYDQKELFDTVFDLYEKFTNTGFANKDNYLKYTFETKFVQNEDAKINKIINKIIADGEKKIASGTKNIVSAISEKTEMVMTISIDENGKRSLKDETKTTESLNLDCINNNIFYGMNNILNLNGTFA